jgi:two-component system chemotaxis response regulator CheB
MAGQDIFPILEQLHAKTEGFCGMLTGIAIHDLVQMLCQVPCGNKKILLKSQQGMGAIYFMDGEIANAAIKDSQVAGEEAFYELLCWKDGTFLVTDASDITKTIHAPWHALLMEAMRRTDERAASSNAKTTEVMIVDDSRLFINVLEKVLTDQCNAKVIGKAVDGKAALRLLKTIRPDLLTIDITMPVMAGDLLLKNIMIRSPAPVLLMSSMGSGTMSKIMEFLRLGAVDYLPKPTSEPEWTDCIYRLKRHMQDVRHYSLRHISRAKYVMPGMNKKERVQRPKKLLVIFGGIGGILEIQRLLPGLCVLDGIGIVIFQDMAEGFLKPFTAYLANSFCFHLSAMENGDIIYGNACKIASWKYTWRLAYHQEQLIAYINQDNEPPDFNIFLNDASKHYGINLYILILSGTRLDLETGLQEVVTQGGHIFLQYADSAIFAEPLLQIAALELEEAHIDPAKIAEIMMAT